MVCGFLVWPCLVSAINRGLEKNNGQINDRWREDSIRICTSSERGVRPNNSLSHDLSGFVGSEAQSFDWCAAATWHAGGQGFILANAG